VSSRAFTESVVEQAAIWFSTKDRVTTAEYEEAMDIPNRTAKNHIGKLVKLGLLRRKGAGPSTFYEVVRPS